MLSDSTTLTLLRRHHLFDKLPEGVFQEVCGLANLRRLETGDSVFHQGNTADRFYVLQNGQIKLTRQDSADGEHHYLPVDNVAGIENGAVRLNASSDSGQ